NGEITITNSLTASLANRVLTITGSADDDVLNIQGGATSVRAFGKDYNNSDFDYIRLDLLDGNDFAEMSNVTISVVGGNGDDTIFTHHYDYPPDLAQQPMNVLAFDGGN